MSRKYMLMLLSLIVSVSLLMVSACGPAPTEAPTRSAHRGAC